MKNFKNYIEENKNRFINELFELLRIPSVSAKPEHDLDVRSAAELLKKHFRLPVVVCKKIIFSNSLRVSWHGW